MTGQIDKAEGRRSYRDALARRLNPPRSYKVALGGSRTDPEGRPVWPLRTAEWASRQTPQAQEKRHG